MTRNAGQVSTGGALRGGALVLLTIVVLVAGAEALLRPTRQSVGHDEAVSAPASPCPGAPLGTSRRPLPVTSAELIECPAAFDSRRVSYEGEVVRAVLRRGEHAWVQLNDDAYALRTGPLPAHRVPAGVNSGIPVLIPAAAAERVSAVGDARRQGDHLRVTGTFLRAHPADAGGPAIDADTVEVVAAGEPIPRDVTPARVVVALLLVAAASATTVAARRSRRR